MTVDIEELNWYKIGFEQASAGMVVLLMEDFVNCYPLDINDHKAKLFIDVMVDTMNRINKINTYIERLISHQSKNDTDDALKRVIIDRYIKQVVKDTNEIKTQMIAMIEEVIKDERNQNEV